ncbi:MAG: MotA/TolQ/ExbB proton channel family protein [Deltaproteobacteria bacterium]|nr:MotA/TolQ/ExbB proton channel family protein [Deltaproteobacteria bacterium]
MLEESVRQAETAAGAKAQPEDIAAMIEQATEALSNAGIKVAESSSTPARPEGDEGSSLANTETDTEAALVGKVRVMFADAALAMRRAGATRTEEGEFFLTDGTLTHGKIFRLGSVAAFGVSDKASGALAPAGGSKLRLWPEPAPETATALVSGTSPETLRLFLFETTDKSIEPKKERGLLEEATLGGMIAWVIVALGCVSVVMILFRFVTLLAASASGRSLTRKVLDAVVARRFREAEAIAAEARGAAARVLRAALRNLGAERTHLEDLLHEAILNETPAIERFGSAITVFAAVAPLLGLLGTVTGMIATFDVITEFGTGDPRMLSGGISEALITTKFGLVVAIPCLLIGNLLAGWGDATIADIEHAALRVVNAAHGLDLEIDENADAGHATEPRSPTTVEPELA